MQNECVKYSLVLCSCSFCAQDVDVGRLLDADEVTDQKPALLACTPSNTSSSTSASASSHRGNVGGELCSLEAFSRRQQRACERAAAAVGGEQAQAREVKVKRMAAAANARVAAKAAVKAAGGGLSESFMEELSSEEVMEMKQRVIVTSLGMWEPTCGPLAPQIEKLHLHRLYERAAQGQLTMSELARLPFDLRLLAVLLRTKLLPYKTLLYQLRSIDQLRPAELSCTRLTHTLVRNDDQCSTAHRS